jgi:hypothetical protein
MAIIYIIDMYALLFFFCEERTGIKLTFKVINTVKI